MSDSSTEYKDSVTGDNPWSQAEIIKNEKKLRSTSNKFQRLLMDMKRIKLQMKPRRYSFKTGKFKKQMLTTGIIVSQKIPLCKLPREIEHMIWGKLETYQDRIAFGLTCKHQATIFQETEPFVKFESLTGLSRKLTYLKLLIRLKSWMGYKYRLCVACLQYTTHKDLTGGNRALIEDENAVGRKTLVQGPHCTDCCIRLRNECLRGKDIHREFMKMIGKSTP